jgi:hypothetical protein
MARACSAPCCACRLLVVGPVGIGWLHPFRPRILKQKQHRACEQHTSRANNSTHTHTHRQPTRERSTIYKHICSFTSAFGACSAAADAREGAAARAVRVLTWRVCMCVRGQARASRLRCSSRVGVQCSCAGRRWAAAPPAVAAKFQEATGRTDVHTQAAGCHTQEPARHRTGDGEREQGGPCNGFAVAATVDGRRRGLAECPNR